MIDHVSSMPRSELSVFDDALSIMRWWLDHMLIKYSSGGDHDWSCVEHASIQVTMRVSALGIMWLGLVQMATMYWWRSDLVSTMHQSRMKHVLWLDHHAIMPWHFPALEVIGVYHVLSMHHQGLSIRYDAINNMWSWLDDMLNSFYSWDEHGIMYRACVCQGLGMFDEALSIIWCMQQSMFEHVFMIHQAPFHYGLVICRSFSWSWSDDGRSCIEHA